MADCSVVDGLALLVTSCSHFSDKPLSGVPKMKLKRLIGVLVYSVTVARPQYVIQCQFCS